jgi:membrane dipeptidase
MISRRKLLIGGAALGGLGALGWWKLRKKPVPIGFEVSREQLAHARSFLNEHVAFDSHAHPGRTFVRGAKGLAPKLKLYQALGTFEKRVVADMQAGGMTAAAFATVSDFHVLDAGKTGLHTHRNFAPGEAWASFVTQNANMRNLVDDGLVYELKSPADLAKARASGKPGAWFTAEGGDFLEGSMERVAEAHGKGLRSITLMHYRTSELGDIITADEVHHGLTPAGKGIIGAMNQLGMMIDVAHASEPTAFGVLAASDQPVMCSHTHIRSAGMPDHPRFISQELATEITQNGGLIGAWPAGIGISTLNGLVDRIFDLIERVGIDHVCLGTDMDANYKPVLDNYRQTPTLVAGLLMRGLSEAETAKVMGGNFVRLWKQVSREPAS